MTGSEYFDELQKIEILLKHKRAERGRWFEAAGSLGSSIGDGVKVQSTKRQSSMTDAADRYIDLDREIAALEAKRDEIRATMERLPANEYSVVYQFFAQGRSLKAIAVDMDRSYSWTKATKKRALQRVETWLQKRG